MYLTNNKQQPTTMSLLTPYAQLSDKQRELISFCTNATENIFLEGPPWSGKAVTCLYSLQNMAQKEDANALFLVTNNAMYGYMSTALKELEIEERVNIDSKNKFFWKMAGDYRVSLNLTADYHVNYDNILTNLLEEELERDYTVIVVSEVQDYLPKEWALIKRIAQKIVCYGDFKQAIYDKKVGRNTIINDCIHKQLNCLNKDVATNKLLKVRNYFFDENEYAETRDDCCEMQPLATDVKYSTIDVKYADELKAIADTIKALEGENSRVAIICPNNNRFAELSFYLKTHGIAHHYYEINGDLRNHDFTSTTPLFISIFNAEGLQFDNVILFGFDESNYIIQMKRKEDRLKIILYVGMTRARNTTYIVRSEGTVEELKNV